MTLRNLARISATGMLAVGVLGLAAAPALAADVDFGVDVTGTTIAADASGKFAKIAITNHGTTTPAGFDLLVDTSKLDANKVTSLDSKDADGCDTSKAGQILCTLGKPFIPAAGLTEKLTLPLHKVAGAKGSAGQVTISVFVKGDTNKANDSKTVDVTVGDNGADLFVAAEDVTTADKEELPNGKPVAPGKIGSLLVAVLNAGDMTAAGLKVQAKLPPQTTLGLDVAGCTASADKRTVTCTENVELTPADKDSQDRLDFAHFLTLPVLVSPEAKGPIVLNEGSVTVTALKQKPVASKAARAAARALPEGYAQLSAAQLAEIDADLSDNTDGFNVLVAGPVADGGNGGQGGGGGLPVTGPAAFGIGGAGLAVLALGTVLLIGARRRRVVLVAPGDEK